MKSVEIFSDLIHAVTSGNITGVRTWILDHPSDINKRFGASFTPLTYIAVIGIPEMYDLILSANPLFDEKTHCAIANSGRHEIIFQTVDHLASKGVLSPKLIAVYFQGLLHHTSSPDGHVETFLKTYTVESKYFSYSDLNLNDKTVPRLAPLLVTYGVLTKKYVYLFNDCAIRNGYYDSMRIFHYIRPTEITVRTVLESPRIVDTVLFITSFDQYRTCRRASQHTLSWFRNCLVANSKKNSKTEIFFELERIYHVRRHVMDELPTLFDMIVIAEKFEYVEREFKKLECRIEEAKITKGWRSILN